MKKFNKEGKKPKGRPLNIKQIQQRGRPGFTKFVCPSEVLIYPNKED